MKCLDVICIIFILAHIVVIVIPIASRNNLVCGQRLGGGQACVSVTSARLRS